MNQKAHIAFQNDLARIGMGIASRVVQTPGIQALDPADQSAIREKVELFREFTPDNDPHGEHNGNRIFWKIDYSAPQ